MRLFSVPTGRRVKVASRLIRWIEHDSEIVVAENLVYEATATARFSTHEQKQRRLLTNHTIPEWGRFGVWQSDIDCEIVEILR